jgi:MoaA/NifB/PqqE/SkfB family radical SAM enzyme
LGNKEETKLDRLLRWQQGETPGPWTLSLFPTYRCNLQCRICWKRCYDEPIGAEEELSDERILRLADEAAEMGVRYWIIGGGGELMLRDRIMMELCGKIRSYGMNGVLQSNGTKFTADHLEHLIRLGWGQLNVSLDGPTAETNDAIRCEGSFDRGIQTIRTLNALRAKHKVNHPVVELVTVVNALNYDRIDSMVELAHELNCTCIHFVSLIVYGNATKGFDLAPPHKQALPELVLRAQALAERLGVNTIFHMYMHGPGSESPRAIQLFKKAGDAVTSNAMCFEPWLSLVIMPSGLAGPCCTFWEPKADSVREKSLHEVWLGPYLREVRRQILSGQPPGYCENCLTNQIFENRTTQVELLGRERQLAPPVRRLGDLVSRGGSSLREHGVRETLRRGKEWWRVRRAMRGKLPR